MRWALSHSDTQKARFSTVILLCQLFINPVEP